MTDRIKQAEKELYKATMDFVKPTSTAKGKTLIMDSIQATAVVAAMDVAAAAGGSVKVVFGSVHTQAISFYTCGENLNVVRVSHYDVLESEIYASKEEFITAYGL